MNNQESEALEYAVNSSFLIGGGVFLVIIAILWFAVFAKKTKKPYPILQMLGVAIAAQSIGIFVFFN